MGTDPVRTLFLAGTGRSGSTILSKLLGSTDGFFAAGEVRYLWARGLADGGTCTCGEPLRECGTWNAILEQAFGAVDAVPRDELAAMSAEVVRIRRLPRLVTTTIATGAMPPAAREYGEVLGRLYRAMRDVTGAVVLVDSSKLPAYGFILDHVDDIDLRVIHLVRDPRAAAHSWMKSDERHGASGDPMDRFSPWKSSTLWSFWHAAVLTMWRRSGRSVLLRYEDFVAAPREVADRITAFAGVDGAVPPFRTDHEAELAVGHLVAGNPVRRSAGPVRFREDDEWRRTMPRSAALEVTAMTAPLLAAFGYGLGARP